MVIQCRDGNLLGERGLLHSPDAREKVRIDQLIVRSVCGYNTNKVILWNDRII